MRDDTRINEFDQWVGEIQTRKVIELGRGSSLLDVGCGFGRYTPTYLERFKYVLGIDPNEEYIKQAQEANNKVEYKVAYGETFDTDMRFDTITMNMLLEHVDNPVELLTNCKRLLARNGVIIIQVPNSLSVTRKLGVLMGIIDSIDHMSKEEIEFCGHKRVYTPETVKSDCESAGLRVIETGGILYKPLPNSILEKICKENGKKWRIKFMNALVEFGKDRPEECANLYICAV